LFWIYGGSLEFGNAGNPNYDGSILAAYQDVVVVTVNYRTNVFGFATSDEIPLAERNLGFLDQRLGLDWVQRNIAAFGGSPYKVTVFGESAGAFSIDALLTSYDKDACVPFRGAILQSGQVSYNPNPNPSTVPAWNQLAANFNCPAQGSVECLRNVPATDIKTYIEENALSFNYAFDNVTAYSNAAERREKGQIARIPILIGSTSQEGRVFQVGQNSAEATRAFVNQISGNVSAYGDMIEAAYPLGSAGISSYYDQVSQIFTEYVFQCTVAKVANASATSGIPAWRYYFNASFPNTQAFGELGVYHASEIPIVFGTYPRTNVTTQQYALSTSMMGIWARFAKNPKGGPGWNPVGSGVASSVLVGATDVGMGGIYIDESGMGTQGAYDLAVLGNRGDSLASGVTVINQQEVDYRCGLFEPTYQAILAGAGT
jgi:acetylcholinesterase